MSLHVQIAIEGCCHGELDQIYNTIQHIERTKNTKIDLLLICGDFQVYQAPVTLTFDMFLPTSARDMIQRRQLPRAFAGCAQPG
jgi:lariat debranching enzyme